MGITVFGRKAIRRVERETGLRIVHMAGPWLTTIDHVHYQRKDNNPDRWVLVDWDGPHCGVNLYSCTVLFGRDGEGYRRHFMRGACDSCGTTAYMQHHWDCPTLLRLLTWTDINPDYWPVPVHLPMWFSDFRYWLRKGKRSPDVSAGPPTS